MRAAVVTEFGAPLQVSELELPTPGYGEALVKLETSGVCDTDLHAAHGDWPVKPQPVHPRPRGLRHRRRAR
jgi:propanol-preferring alcohol dehydrogenase